MRTATVSGLLLFVLLSLACGSVGSDSSLPTREEFSKRLEGKTRAEVLRLLGRPTSTQDSGDKEIWVYERVCRDPIADQVDVSTWVHIGKGDGGKVLRVQH